MPPQTRRASFPKIVIERDTDSEESSSEEEEETVEEEEELNEEKRGKVEDEVVKGDSGGKGEQSLDMKRKRVGSISISLKKVCKVSLI